MSMRWSIQICIKDSQLYYSTAYLIWREKNEINQETEFKRKIRFEISEYVTTNP